MALWQRRTQRLKLVAAELGLSYDEVGNWLIPYEAHRFYLFHTPPYYFRHFLHGWYKDTQLTVFDLRKDANRYPQQTVVRFVSYDLSVPHFAVIPIHSFIHSHPVFGEATLNFRQTDIQFANLYIVQGHDELGLRKLLHEQLRARLKRLGNRHCEGKGDQFYFYYQGHHIQPGALPDFIEQAYGVFELFIPTFQ